MDSIGAAELASELHARLGMRFHATVIFEFPTARAIAEHVLERASPSWDREPRRKPAATPSADGDAARHPVALRGLASRWPAACESSAQLRAVLRSGGDAVGTVPARRWMASDDAVPHPPAARHGSFVREAERFDCAFFGLSPAESAAMDPQQRLLLEVGYAALHNAGHRRAPLLGSDTGVFLGIQNTDWLQGAAGAAASSVYAVSGGTISIAAGRLSFALGLHGPCASVDTACSSALVALHGARQALRAAECGEGVVLAHTHEAPVSHHLSSSPCALRRCHASSSSSRRITQRSPPSLDSSCARQRHASPRGRTSRRRCGSLRATDRTTRHSVPTSFRCVCASYYCPLYPPAHAAHS